MEDLWAVLALEGNFDLINKLRMAEAREPGFGTIVVTEKGFSENDVTHNLVLDWLKERNINIVDVPFIVGNLELTLLRERPAFLQKERAV